MMSVGQAQWDAAQGLFEGTLERAAEERASYLEHACADPDLRKTVLQMVVLHEANPAFLEAPLSLAFLTAPLLDEGEVVAGRFRILRSVGIGGMAEVYEATDEAHPEHLERVALKIMRPDVADVEELAARIHREPQLAHRITHPNVCKVHFLHVDRSSSGTRLILIMDFLDGQTLRERLERSGPLDKPEALSLARQIAAGVDEAHREGVIHRDLKSSNVMLVPRKDGTTRAVITDFGIAASEEEKELRLGTGTIEYMAPERLVDAGATRAADIYSFGALMYEMVAGRPPFDSGCSLDERRGFPRPPSAIRREVGRKWDRAILRCLHPSPGERFTSATDAVDALQPSRMWIAAAVMMLATLVAWPAFDRISGPTPVPAVSMLPFELIGRIGPEAGLVDYLAEQIQKNPGIRKKWLVFSPAEARQLGVSTAQKALAVFGATHVVSGTLTATEAAITIDAHLLEAASGRAVRTFRTTCPLDNDVCIQDGLVRGLAGVLDPQSAAGPQSAPISKTALPYYLRGIEYLRRDSVSYDLAIESFQQALARDSAAVLPRVGLADGFMLRFRGTGDRAMLTSARNALQEVLAAFPDLPDVHASFGNLYRVEGRYDEAVRELLIAVQGDPTNHVFLRWLGATYDLARHDNEAIAAFENALTLQPRYWAAYLDYGVFHYRRGRFDQAASLMEQLLQWTPDHAQVLGALGGVYVAMGRNADAERVSRRSCSLSPARACYANLGVALQRQRRTTEAIAEYERALLYGPPDVILLLGLADAHAFLGKSAEAMDFFGRCARRAEEGLRVNLQNSSQRAILGYCLAQTGDRTRATFEVEQALQHSPDDKNVRRYGVLTFESLGQRERALEILRHSSRQVLEELELSWGTERLRQDPRYSAAADEARTR